jgi:hypothetical protein
MYSKIFVNLFVDLCISIFFYTELTEINYKVMICLNKLIYPTITLAFLLMHEQTKISWQSNFNKKGFNLVNKYNS